MAEAEMARNCFCLAAPMEGPPEPCLFWLNFFSKNNESQHNGQENISARNGPAPLSAGEG